MSVVSGANGAARSQTHLPSLDGLRGVAILLVIVYHSLGPIPALSPLDYAVRFFASGGWSGVQLFFVLSGFLITGILLDARGGRHYFRSFYIRRILRIFPLYYAVFALYLLAAFVLPRHWTPPLGVAAGQELWYAFYLSNFSMASRAGLAPSTLGVSWSLAIEEQFYLVWPLVVWLLPRRWLLRLCLALVLGSFAWRVVMAITGVPAVVTYVQTQSELGAISIGAALAVWQRGAGGLQQLVPWARCMFIAAPLLLLSIGAQSAEFGLHFSNPLMLTVGFLLLQLLCAALVVLALNGNLAVRVLQTRALRVCGRWSYGMYLFHPIVLLIYYAPPARHIRPLLFGSTLPQDLLITVLAIGATLAIAALSSRFYEQPFLRLKRLVPMISAADTKQTTASPRRAKQCCLRLCEGVRPSRP